MKKRLIIITGLIVLTLCILGGIYYKFFYKSSLVENEITANGKKDLALYVCDKTIYNEEAVGYDPYCEPVDNIPVGDYRIDPFKSYCENGSYSNYDKENGTIKYIINGAGECSVYFRDYLLYDYIVENAERMGAINGQHLIFAGSSPQNYILIENVLYRIVGIDDGFYKEGVNFFSDEYKKILDLTEDTWYVRSDATLDSYFSDAFFVITPVLFDKNNELLSGFEIYYGVYDEYYYNAIDYLTFYEDFFSITEMPENFRNYTRAKKNVYGLDFTSNLDMTLVELLNDYDSFTDDLYIKYDYYLPISFFHFYGTSPYDYCRDVSLNEFITGPCLNDNWLLDQYLSFFDLIALNDIKSISEDGAVIDNYYLVYNDGWSLSSGQEIGSYYNGTIPLYSFRAEYSIYKSGTGTIDDPLQIEYRS